MNRKTAVSRRALLKQLGMAGAAVLALPELSRVLSFRLRVFAQAPVLSPAESATLAAVCARIIPTDENGPGATEARASAYIDRALGGWLAASRADYTAGLAAVDAAARSGSGRAFADLPAARQDAVLATLEETPFFALVRAHTIQGTFCDPAYGGNANFVGWDLLGYPGVRLNVTAADQRMSGYAKPVRRSAYDYAMFAATTHEAGNVH
ncbi:MAG: gluconate 2-dehydrogenase subunit 3 family protein [Acidobacteria bacterium]|nr:MAG: gluconate 2-dehydrogenase subunit 3 family protein [Acidobacteriota bacterium]